MLKKKRSSIAAFSAAMMLLAACGSGSNDGSGADASTGSIVISGKEYTEQIIMTNVLAEYLDANTDLDVEVKGALGGVFVLQEAMQKGDIDAYVEYTGTGYLNVLDEDFVPGADPDELYESTKDGYLEEFNIKWLEPLGFNNTYALTLRASDAEELGVETASDLIEHSDGLVFGSDAEFYERGDGYDALVEEYGYEFDSTVTIDPDLMYSALKDNEMDVITAYTTDPRIPEYDLQPLVDDANFFPPYHAAVIIREEVLAANPGLEETLNELSKSGAFTDETVSELNGRVSTEGEKERDVAIDFLKENDLID